MVPAAAYDTGMPVPAPDPLTQSFGASVDGHAIMLVPSGPERLERLLAMIGGAQRSLSILFYIYAADAAGTQVRDALTDAARRGVAVTMLLDRFGSSTTPDSFFAPLRDAGAAVRWFGTRWTPRYLIRNHQKLVIADSERVMTGGFNIEADYFAPTGDPAGWQDLAVMLDGPAVAAAVRWFDALDDWLDAPRPRFRDLRRLVRRWHDQKGPVRWLIGGPAPRLSPWARCLRRDLAGARRLDLSVAYFAPDAGLLRRIGAIARRGSATLVLPARSDNAATVGASRLLYGFLLRRSARIAEYEPSLLHNKLIVIDDIVLVGSANLDMRSLYVNMELTLRIEDAGLAAQCRSLIAAQRALSTPIDMALHKRRAGWINRLRWFASWLVVSVIDYSVTRRLNFGLGKPPV